MKKNIVIIGAGYTGLVAALRLAEAGHKVTVLEREKTIGGLAGDFQIEGQSIEIAYHHIFKTDTDIISLANELGVGDKLKWHDSSTSLYYDNELYPFKGALDLIKFKPLTFVNRIRAGLVTLYLQYTNNWEKFRYISAYDWMLKAAGKQVTEVIWEPLLKGKFDKHYNEVSMSWLWARIHIRAKSREAGGEKLGYFENGFQIFTNALVNKIKELGVEIKTNTDIKQINNSTDEKVIIKLSNDQTMSFDKCIVTIPSNGFAKLIKENKNVETKYVDQLNSINYLGARLLVFSSTQKISPYYWHNINDLNLPFLVFIHHTKLIDKKFYNGKYIYYIATYVPHDDKLFTCSDKEIAKIWFSGLKQIFPKFKEDAIREKHFYKFKNAQHIVDADYQNKIPSSKTPLPNILLSNFSQIYPEDRGTNFAVKEGEKVAKLI